MVYGQLRTYSCMWKPCNSSRSIYSFAIRAVVYDCRNRIENSFLTRFSLNEIPLVAARGAQSTARRSPKFNTESHGQKLSSEIHLVE